jgi:hypothetical protein
MKKRDRQGRVDTHEEHPHSTPQITVGEGCSGEKDVLVMYGCDMVEWMEG